MRMDACVVRLERQSMTFSQRVPTWQISRTWPVKCPFQPMLAKVMLDSRIPKGDNFTDEEPEDNVKWWRKARCNSLWQCFVATGTGGLDLIGDSFFSSQVHGMVVFWKTTLVANIEIWDDF